jgi:hypothetical protein
VTAICRALSFLFAFVVLSSLQPVEVRIDYTPAAWSAR